MNVTHRPTLRSVNQVKFRASPELLAELRARGPWSDSGLMGVGMTAHRDIQRYYATLAASLPTFTPEQAQFLYEATAGTRFELDTIRLLWADVREASRVDGLDAKFGIDGDALARYLSQECSNAAQFAIVDALERARLILKNPDMPTIDALVDVGLVAHDHE